MPTSGFHSEWLTTGESRILLRCRASFPDERMKLMAQVAVETCAKNSSTRRAAVVEVYFNDQTAMCTVLVASTDESDRKLGPILQDILQSMSDTGNVRASVIVVPEGNMNSDNYDHMEHLSVAAGVGADRWEHEDETNQVTFERPA
jgi:hypothetical protein